MEAQAEIQQGVKVLERYMLLGRPLVEAMIVEDPDGRRYYNVIEPKLDTRVRQDSLTELLSLVSKDALLLEKVNAAATVEKRL
ncbi:MAG: hypothetical protein OSP8Acid_04500 [uncultured Acidilobus sp. OSP8]|jgi:hypothetical protein|nr:MAG: hypothetical protein OSP8Acid_04500 [uncultured Acidilobus sp. OSP8]